MWLNMSANSRSNTAYRRQLSWRNLPAVKIQLSTDVTLWRLVSISRRFESTMSLWTSVNICPTTFCRIAEAPFISMMTKKYTKTDPLYFQDHALLNVTPCSFLNLYKFRCKLWPTDSSEILVNIYKTTWRQIPRHSAVIHSVSRRPLTVENQVPSHSSAYGIYGGKVGNGKVFPPRTSVFPSSVPFHQ